MEPIESSETSAYINTLTPGTYPKEKKLQGCVMLVVFPLWQWLHDRAWMLRYTRISFLVFNQWRYFRFIPTVFKHPVSSLINTLLVTIISPIAHSRMYCKEMTSSFERRVTALCRSVYHPLYNLSAPSVFFRKYYPEYVASLSSTVGRVAQSV